MSMPEVEDEEEGMMQMLGEIFRSQELMRKAECVFEDRERIEELIKLDYHFDMSNKTLH